MKKYLFILLALLTFNVSDAQESCCMPVSCCFDPCCWDDYCWFGGCCHPGLYIGGQAGYAWIQSPHSDDRDEEWHEGIEECRGNFAWGIFGGYNARVFLCNLYAGIEGGYHDNGDSEITFKESSNRYRLRSQDIDISATLNYVLCKSFNVFLKVGGARVREKFERDKTCDQETKMCSSSERQWAPVVSTGVGYCLFNWLNVNVAYRGVFAHNTSQLKDAFHFKNEEMKLSLNRISSVHSVYGGLTLTF